MPFFLNLYFHSQTPLFSAMYFAVPFHFQSVVFITILLAAVSHALPLERRTDPPKFKYMDGLGCSANNRDAAKPCACQGELPIGISKSLAPKNCGENGFLYSVIKTATGDQLVFKLVSSSYSKGIISLNPQGLGSYNGRGEPCTGQGLACGAPSFTNIVLT